MPGQLLRCIVRGSLGPLGVVVLEKVAKAVGAASAPRAAVAQTGVGVT